MITDAELLYSDAQAVTVDAISTNVYDSDPQATGNTGMDFGSGEPLYIHLFVDTTFVGATGTLTVTFESSAAAALTSPNVHWTSPVIPVATLVAGYHIQVAVPVGNVPLFLRFNGFRYDNATAAFTAGNITALISRHAEVAHIYASGLNFV